MRDVEILISFYQLFECFIILFGDNFEMSILREKFNLFLVFRDISFICYVMVIFWEEVVERIKWFYRCKVRQVVFVVLEEIVFNSVEMLFVCV